MPDLVFDEDRLRWVNAAAIAQVPAGGVGAAAGGWDTAANRDAAITRVNSILTLLRQFNWTSAANAPAGGAGALAGGYDTAANRNTMISALNSCLTALRNAGYVSTGTLAVSGGAAFDETKLQYAASAAIADIPAGGTGVAAGCYDTAANRDTFISRVNTILTAMRDNGLLALD